MILYVKGQAPKARCAECDRLYSMHPSERGNWHLCEPCRKAIDAHLNQYGWARARRPGEPIRRQA
jgi:hypothetical protein